MCVQQEVTRTPPAHYPTALCQTAGQAGAYPECSPSFALWQAGAGGLAPPGVPTFLAHPPLARRGPEGPGSACKGHRRGLPELAQAGFVRRKPRLQPPGGRRRRAGHFGAPAIPQDRLHPKRVWYTTIRVPPQRSHR
jgi:hypothetical protein